MASRIGSIKFPEPTHGTGRKRYVTVRDIISKYPPIRAGQKSRLIPNHTSARLTKINLNRIKSIPKDGGTRKNLPKNLSLKCHDNHRGHTDVYGRLAWDKVSPTLTCRCISLSNGRFGHPTQNRALSVREAAALQTFPDDYVFYGEKTKTALHVGNAVPVLLAQKLGSSIVKKVRLP
jgi:DNA (cytosine-5)-methyltransferase 1